MMTVIVQNNSILQWPIHYPIAFWSLTKTLETTHSRTMASFGMPFHILYGTRTVTWQL